MRFARHAAGAAILSFMSVVVTASPAAGHVVYDAYMKYESKYYCSRVRSEVSHGQWNYGYAKADSGAMTYATMPWGDIDCKAWRHMQPGHIAVRYILYKQTSGGPRACAWIAWTHNPSRQTKVVASWHFFADDYCGPGSYQTSTGGYVWDGSRWRGGWVDSGWHSLPV